MGYLISKKPKPNGWDGKYLLECTHHYNSKSYDDFLMYCNLLKEMPDGRVKIKVFGCRWKTTTGEKIRYVSKNRVSKVENFNI